MKTYVDQLKKEGFAHVYEWTDEPGVEYNAHAHKGRVSFFVTKGNITMNINGNIQEIKTGERIDVPVGVVHTGKVGPDGCSFVVGEEIEGDS